MVSFGALHIAAKFIGALTSLFYKIVQGLVIHVSSTVWVELMTYKHLKVGRLYSFRNSRAHLIKLFVKILSLKNNHLHGKSYKIIIKAFFWLL